MMEVGLLQFPVCCPFACELFKHGLLILVKSLKILKVMLT